MFFMPQTWHMPSPCPHPSIHVSNFINPRVHTVLFPPKLTFLVFCPSFSRLGRPRRHLLVSGLCGASVGRGTSTCPQACLTTLSSLLTSLSHFVAVFSRLVQTTYIFVVRTSRGQTKSFKGLPPRPLCLYFAPLLILCFIASFVLYGHF